MIPNAVNTWWASHFKLVEMHECFPRPGSSQQPYLIARMVERF